MIKSTINQFLNWHNKLCLFEQADSGFGLDDQEQASEKHFRSAVRQASEARDLEQQGKPNLRSRATPEPTRETSDTAA